MGASQQNKIKKTVKKTKLIKTKTSRYLNKKMKNQNKNQVKQKKNSYKTVEKKCPSKIVLHDKCEVVEKGSTKRQNM